MGFWEILCIIIAIRHGVIAGFLAWIGGYVFLGSLFLLCLLILKCMGKI